MSIEAIKILLTELPRLSVNEFSEKLSLILEEVSKYEITEFLREFPDFFARVLYQIKDRGAADLCHKAPALADLLSNLLWQGVSRLTKKSPETQVLLNKIDRKLMRINIEACDSPFNSHFIIQNGKIKGDSGLLHFKDEDFRFMGPTEVLIDLLLGDLYLGFNNLRLQTSGHSGWLPRLSPVLGEVSKILKGEKNYS